MLLRLDLNTGIVFDLLGDYRQALKHYESALQQAEALGEAGEPYLGALYTNRGYAYSYLGELQRAMADLQRAHAVCAARGETHGAAVAQMNMAYIEQAQGHYRRALALLHEIFTQVGEHILLESTARRDMVECYLELNRYPEARELALSVVEAHREAGAAYEMARTLLLLRGPEAELAHYDAALGALDAAEETFASLGQSRGWRPAACGGRGSLCGGRSRRGGTRPRAGARFLPGKRPTGGFCGGAHHRSAGAASARRSRFSGAGRVGGAENGAGVAPVRATLQRAPDPRPPAKCRDGWCGGARLSGGVVRGRAGAAAADDHPEAGLS